MARSRKPSRAGRDVPPPTPAQERATEVVEQTRDRIDGLIGQLNHSETKVQLDAINVLAEIGQESVLPLLAALNHPDAVTRHNSIAALGRIGGLVAEVLPASISLLGDDDADVRRASADALDSIGPGAAPAVPALIEGLRDTNQFVAANATAALKRIGPAAVPALVKALVDANPGVRARAASALG